MAVTKAFFGETRDGKAVDCYTITNKNGMSAEVTYNDRTSNVCTRSNFNIIANNRWSNNSGGLCNLNVLTYKDA